MSENESKSYWQSPAFFTITDSSDTEQQQPEITFETQWSKASETVEKEYLRFFSLITDYDKEFVIVARKSFIDSVLKKYY